MRKRKGYSPVTLALIAATLLLASLVILLVRVEGNATPSWEVLENAMITLMGEYPDKPQTIAGRILQLLLLVFGTFAFGAIVGKISSIFVTRALRQERDVRKFNNHIIICNWNEKAPAIVHQLLEANRDTPKDILIISSSFVETHYYFEDQDQVYFVQADPTHHATLEEFQAPQARAVILLADEDSEGPDEKNALIALAIKHLEQIPGRERNIHVVGELVKLNRRRHLKEAGVDEIISSRDYSSGIIAQSALFRNMSVVYQQLLTYSDDSNEFYFIEPGNYPEAFYGRTFVELSTWMSDYNMAHPDNPLLLLGIKRRDGEILLNPKQSQFRRLSSTDSLIVMAFRNVDRIG